MPRYFIRDPLEAALAAKNHGFKFIGLVEDIEYDWLRPEAYIGLGGWVNKKYYIADESLVLLEPIVGDRIVIADRLWFEVSEHDYEAPHRLISVQDAIKVLKEGVSRIMERNNLPFPKIEADDEAI